MPAIPKSYPDAGARNVPDASPNNKSRSPLTGNIHSTAISATGLTHYLPDMEDNTHPPATVKSRLLTIEEDEQLQAENRRHLLPSCSCSLVVAGIALLTSAGAFTYSLLHSNTTSLENPETAPVAGGENATADIFYPQAQALSASPSGLNRRNKSKSPCYLTVAGIKTNTEIPCKKGKGMKHWPDIDTLPACRRKKVLNRCRRKYARVSKTVNKVVIKRKGKRCVCPLRYKEENNTKLSSENSAQLPQLKRGNNYHYIDDNPPIRKAKTTTSIPTTDEVGKKELFDQTCVQERADLSWAQILRQFGKSLSEPTTEAFKEGKIAYDYIIKEAGCPSPESLERAMKITTAIDYTLSTVISLIPGTKLVTVAQNIVGPILELLADSIDGKEIDFAKLTGIDQQIMYMMRPAIPTMSRNEQAALYGKLAKDVEIPKVDTAILTKRYLLRDNQIYVKVADKEYLLHKGLDNRPFVERNRFINFNHLTKKWMFVENSADDIFSRINLENRDRYGIALEQMPDSAWIQFKEYDFVRINSAGKESMEGVFLGGKFVPAEWDHVAGNFVAYTHDVNSLEQRVIVFSDNGWIFERPSVKMDKNLEIFLDNFETGIEYYPENRISAIDNENGLCVSEQNSHFIKSKYKYYEVEKVAGEANSWALANDPFTRIKLDNGLFKLTDADNMLFGLRSDRIPGAISEADSFFLETAALDYLLDHGVTTQSAPVRAIRPGLYVDKDNNPIFVANGVKFVVNNYSDRHVYIKREQDGLEGDIALWSDHDSWLRVRDDSSQVADYQEIAACRIARAPASGKGCLPVAIEMELHQHLQKHIDNGMTSNYYPVPGSLRQLTSYALPAVFQDINTQKYYFLYAGKYFDAKLIDTLDTNNPTGFPVIKVTGRGGFLKREKIIADIILEQKADRFEIKEVDTFIAEQLHIKKGIASFYNEHRRYRYQPVIPALEDLISEARVADEVFVAQPPEPGSVKVKPDISAHYDRAKQALFSPRIINSEEHEIEFIKLDARIDPLDNRLKSAQQYVQENVHYLKDQVITDVSGALNYADNRWADTGLYLSHLVDSSDTRFLTRAGEAFRQTLQNIDSAVDPQEIYLVRAVNKYAKAARHVDANPYQSTEERYAGKLLFRSETGDNRLFINIDKLPLAENTVPEADLMGLIIEEIISTQQKNAGFFTIARTNGIYPATSDIVNEMLENIESSKLTTAQLNNLKETSRTYLQNVPAYKTHINDLLSPQKLAYLARNDRGYLAHLMLHSTPCLTAMTEDLYCLLAQAGSDAAGQQPWVESYLNRRELSTIRKEPAVSTAGVDINQLPALNIDKLNVGRVEGKPGIFYTEPGLDLLYEHEDKYYPAEFIGKNNRIIFIGPRDKARQVYYYDPQQGNVTPLQQAATRNNAISYHRQLDLYQSLNADTGETAVLKYDAKAERLIPTGAKKIVPLVNDVIKVEYPGFDIFYPEEAGHEVFLAAHGSRQITLRNTQVPENAKIFFYTKKWQSLQGHRDDLLDLVKGKIESTESKASWEKLETYDITLDQDSLISYPSLAQESRKTLIRINPDSEVSSKDIIDAVSRIFSDKQIEIHLYICRSL